MTGLPLSAVEAKRLTAENPDDPWVCWRVVRERLAAAGEDLSRDPSELRHGRIGVVEISGAAV